MPYALKLTDWGLKLALRHEKVAHLTTKGNRIGRGTFCVVYNGSTPDTVLKITLDDRAYELATCANYAMRGEHAPVVTKDYGQIGTARIGYESFPIYAFEVERLEKVTSSILRKLVRALSNSAQTHQIEQMNSDRRDRKKIDDSLKNYDLFRKLADDFEESHPKIAELLEQIATFCGDWGDSGMDLHYANFMQRGSGTLVINDPVVCISKLQLCHRSK